MSQTTSVEESPEQRVDTEKLIYFFGGGAAEGTARMRDQLGGKGTGLAEMTNAGVPVPPGFTITTDVCRWFYANSRTLPTGFESQQAAALELLERRMGKKLGDARDPLLVSVRSGARFSMPGMMDTILNLGLNDDAVQGLARQANDERFAWDSYRRFVQMFGKIVLDIDGEKFEQRLDEAKATKG